MILRQATSGDREAVRAAVVALEARGVCGTGAALVSGQLSAWVAEAASGRRGVLLLAISRYGPGTPSLWVAGAYAPGRSTVSELRTALRLLQRLASQHGCRRVEFSSMRPGWQRRAKRLGFAAVATIWAKEI